MIRMAQSRSAGHAKAYFNDALSKSDYYTSNQELPGYWQGRLAERLGLSGATSKEDFFDLCENVHPVTGDHLTPRTKEERTTGYDINFHCPKSVSLLHVFAGDDHILNAFREAVTETMSVIEADSQTRVRQHGQYADRQTGELVWGHFVHQTARPVEGQLPDPHLHSHCFVFNATWDEEEKRFKAGQFRDINRDMPYYQARFHKTLADKLESLGYRIRRTEKSFEVEGVPKEATALFSKRTDEIGRVAKEKGITDAKELGELGARTRAKKQKGASMEELKQEWQAQIRALGRPEKAGTDKPVRFAPSKDQPVLTASQCVDHAVLHSFERASVMQDRRVLAEAYRHALGSGVSAEDITRQFAVDSRLIHITENGRRLCTTREVLAEEKRMVELARQGQDKMIPLYKEAPQTTLNGQQGEAVAHVLTAAHRVSIIRGAAGTGKTTLMKEAISKMEAVGKTVTVVAPTSQAARGVLKEEERFANAETVARLLIDPKMQERLKDQVLWVDEAGLLGTQDMTRILEIATAQNARVILGGDTRQHSSVVRGDALRILNTVAGVKVAEVSKIYRQKDAKYRAAIEDLSKGHMREGFEKLDGMGFIRTVDPMKPHRELVEAYVAAMKKKKTALVISPTHAQGEEVTAQIRARLREEGLIGKKEITITQLKNLNLTEAERADPRNFEKGQVVQFEQNAQGFKRGSVWMVEGVKGSVIQVKNADGETKTLPTKKSRRYGVYVREEIRLSKGDKVRITKNGFGLDEKRLDNGKMLEVVSVSKKGKITLRNRLSKETYTLSHSFGHIAHAHCITSHASQGKNVDEVFVYQPAGTFPATDAKQFYVSVSRGKERARIYTDDKEALLQYASEVRERLSALELMDRGGLSKEFALQTYRDKQKESNHPKTDKDGFDR